MVKLWFAFFSCIPHNVMQESCGAIQSTESTKLSDIKIQQNSFEMWTSKLYVPYSDTAFSNDTRTSTKYWKCGT